MGSSPFKSKRFIFSPFFFKIGVIIKVRVVMLTKELRGICAEYYRRLKRAKTIVRFDDFRLTDLKNLAQKTAEEAKKNYSQLTKPKICSLQAYIHLWVRESLDREFTLKTLRKVDLKKSSKDPHSRALASFFYHLPLELMPHLKKRVFNAPFPKRQKIWQEFDLPLAEIEKNFKKVVLIRKKEVKRMGYSSFINNPLEKYKIPQKSYNQFIENIDQLIKNLNQQLPKIKNLPPWFYSEFNLPCFICQLPSFPFRSLEEVFNFVAKEHPLLKKFQKKIKIKIGGKNTFTLYEKKRDIIKINLEKGVNIRHQAILLIHELGHAVSFLEYLGQGRDLLFVGGKYGAEKEAIKVETNLLKKASYQLYRASLGEVLLFPFRNTLFEIKLYQNPNQDLSKLYARSFNRCFLEAKQKKNPLYLLEEHFIISPFSHLPHAIARYHVLSKEIKNK